MLYPAELRTLYNILSVQAGTVPIAIGMLYPAELRTLKIILSVQAGTVPIAIGMLCPAELRTLYIILSVQTGTVPIAIGMLYPAELRIHLKGFKLTVGKIKFKKKKTPERVFFEVGAAGFEPATSWSQTRRDDRTTLRPE